MTKEAGTRMFHILLLLGSLLLYEQGSQAAPLAKGNCNETCGSVAIPFPFGIGKECFLDDWYEIDCQKSSNSTIPVLKKANLTVLNISLSSYWDRNGMINVTLPIIYSSIERCGGNGSIAPVSLKGSQFIFSDSMNVFVAVGCNITALMSNTESAILGCQSSCEADTDFVKHAACSGSDGCCHSRITSGLQAFGINFQPQNEAVGDHECQYAFLGDSSQFAPLSMDFNKLRASRYVAAVLEWGVADSSESALEISFNFDDSYYCSKSDFDFTHRGEKPFWQCSCRDGFTGNPYIKDGCKDVDECEDPDTCFGSKCVNQRGSYDCVDGSSTLKSDLIGSQAAPLAKGNCTGTCGGVAIPFPFGIGKGCFLDDWYEIDCQKSSNSNIPVLKKLNLTVLNISLSSLEKQNGIINVTLPIIYSSIESCGSNRSIAPVSLKGSQFIYSDLMNVFVAVGCNITALMNNTESAILGCQSSCEADTDVKQVACSGSDGCCHSRITSGLQAFGINFQPQNEAGGDHECQYAFLGDSSQFAPSSMDFNKLSTSRHFAAVLEWGVADFSEAALDIFFDFSSPNNSYYCSKYESVFTNLGEKPFWQCACYPGFTGNPYIKDGCKDVDECEDPNMCPGGKCVNQYGSSYCIDGSKTIKSVLIGVGSGLGALLLCLLVWWLYYYLKKRKEIKLKEKYFKRNGGLLLERELTSPEGNVEKSKLFNSKDLECATDNFNDDRILGQGGQGTVYKGMLTDGKIVAVKKSKAIDELKVEQFINEILILSQINHRNVVKLIGCCLETEVPLLVYEFIPNGTLYQYLHDPDAEFPVSWDKRLQIATEIAGALFYLHSAASIPIYHRDIKSSNILLDEKYRARVADFGTSMSVSLDQTHVTTLVQGTFGYLDPEYFQSSQFTDKSDVYSFGVVLVELITGQKPILPLREEERRSLATYFIISMEENHLFDIVDPQVLKEGEKEEIASVANLAKRCLNLNGRIRPTMKEVAMELEGIRKLPNHSGIQQNQENHEATESSDAASSFSESNSDADFISFSDVQPILPSETW